MISLAAIGCRSTQPSTLPAVSVAVEETSEADGIARAEYHGIPGLFVTYDAWRRILVRVEEDKATLAVQLVRAQAGEKIAEDEAAALRKSQASLQWRATWGLPLGIGIGASVVTVLGVVLGATLGGIGK